MRIGTSRLAVIILINLVALSFNACSGSNSRPEASISAPASAIPPEGEAVEKAIRFLEDRVSRDHDDFIAYNKLAGYYLQRQRDTGSLSFLELASRAARASLAAMPAQHNLGALTAITQTENVSHEFASSRDHARQLAELDPAKSYPYQMLGDALVELGDYEAAKTAFGEMQKRGNGTGVEIRLARFALIQGDVEGAKLHFANAAALAIHQPNPSPETVAWCRWQLGEVAFSTGDYETAESQYRDALVTFPGYYRALASLGRVLAARGDMQGAIEQYEHAVRVIPDPAFVASLGDLYKLLGREPEAASQYKIVEHIAKLSVINGAVYNRQLALFYADHDIKALEAYANASTEYAVRHDVYGADAVAWTALKAGNLTEAHAAMKEALKLGTRDAKLFYHAGMIARAENDLTTSREYLRRALALNPHFDPLQAANASKALEAME